MRKLKLQELKRLSVDAFRRSEKTPVVLILDNIRSGMNVGSAFRTADAFALQRVVLCGITARPPHREILKTAIGATESVAWSYEEDPAKAVRQLQLEGYKVYAVEQAVGSVPLQEFKMPADGSPVALVFGNEVSGVLESVMELVDGAIEVPQFGTKHSLNVAVCVGVVVWELVRRVRF
jgi:23S rRNA (guanosine2251-2'-O)-methyltransferase